jgi:hypothetical protein
MGLAEELTQRIHDKRNAEQRAIDWRLHEAAVLKTDSVFVWESLTARIKEKIAELKEGDVPGASALRVYGRGNNLTLDTETIPLIKINISFNSVAHFVRGTAYWQIGRRPHECALGPFRMIVNHHTGITLDNGSVETVADEILKPVGEFLVGNAH